MEAKELFRRGVVLYGAGDTERALDYFGRSRALYASKQNTINVAICLDRLGRSDEALELYEEVIASYGAELTADERATIPQLMAPLRARLGALEIAGNVSGSVVVDGRERGKLPLSAPIRTLPGSHSVRVIKDGYKSFEARVDVPLGGVKSVDARLDPLSSAGGLRVEDPRLEGADVTVDSVKVGVVPWEGTLAPGPHVVFSRKDAVGSAPTLAIVLQGQTTLLRLRSAPLGPTTRVLSMPRTAEIRINNVPVGHGDWTGNLPSGSYEAEAIDEGYFPNRLLFSVPTEGDAAPPVTLSLSVDRSHPRWPKASAGHVWVGGMAAFGVSPSLHSGAEERCWTACNRSIPTAVVAGIRAGWELPVHLSIEVDAGYLAAHSSLSRNLSARFPRDTRFYQADYQISDDVDLRGIFVGPGVSYRVPLGRSAWSLRTRAVGGLLFAQSRDQLSSTASAGADRVAALVEHAVASVASTAGFALIDLGVERTIGSWRVGLGLTAFATPFANGPNFNHGAIVIPNTCVSTSPGAIGCAGASSVADGERAYGPVMVIAPQLTASWLP